MEKSEEKKKKDKATLLKIGKAIQFWRKLEGYDQFSFSEALGTVRSYVARLESGHTGVSISRIGRIAEILGVDTFTLMTGVPDPRESAVLLDLYKDAQLNLTKAELEVLFCSRLYGKIVNREFYLNTLAVYRSGVFTVEPPA
jgi:transcriptional regulator with XRE-family HTH domain